MNTISYVYADLELMCDIIFMLSTHGWEKVLEEDNDMATIEWMVERFAIPLQGTLANTDEIVKEFREMISYATSHTHAHAHAHTHTHTHTHTILPSLPLCLSNSSFKPCVYIYLT